MSRGQIIVAVDTRDGKHFAVIEVHEPCLTKSGHDHVGCTVLEHFESLPYDDEHEAMAVALASRDGIELAPGCSMVGDWKMIAKA